MKHPLNPAVASRPTHRLGVAIPALRQALAASGDLARLLSCRGLGTCPSPG